MKPLRVVALAIVFALLFPSQGFAVPAAPNETQVEAVVVKMGKADNHGTVPVTLKILAAQGDYVFAKDAELIVGTTPKLVGTLRVNDTIHAKVSQVGHEWYNFIRLYDVTVTRRHSALTLVVPKANYPTARATQFVARSPGEWEKKFMAATPVLKIAVIAPKIDWKRKMSLFVSLGRSTQGRKVEIVKVEERLKEIVVSIRTTETKGEVKSTFAWHLVAVPRSDLPVRFAAEGQEDPPVQVPFEVIAHGHQGHWREPMRRVITDEKEWKALWHKKGEAKPPVVDFLKKAVFAIALGERRTGSYSVRIEKILQTTDRVEVFVKEIAPPRGGMVGQVLTYPYYMVAIDRLPLPISFVDILPVLQELHLQTSAERKKEYVVVRTSEALQRLLKDLPKIRVPYSSPDFKRQMGLAVFSGPVSNVAFKITRIEKRTDRIDVEVTTTPVKGHEAKTCLFELAVIERSDLPVHFTGKVAQAPDKPVAPKPKRLDYAVGRIIVLFKKTVGHDEQLKIIEALGCKPGSRFKSINGYLVTIPPEHIPADPDGIDKVMHDYLKKWQTHAGVKSAELDKIMRMHR